MYAVIMAGGQGTRLWPLSRQKKPKQLQSFAGDKSLIRETYERLSTKFKVREIIISTTPDFIGDIKKILPELPHENFITEPFLMGNAAACGLVSAILNKRDPESSAVFLPSDHMIKDSKKFLEILSYGENLVEKQPDHLVLIGINPTQPDTGLGYIQMNSQIDATDGLKAFSVKRFIEKPTMEKAKQYVSSWEYLWNAGMFIWKTKFILELFEKNMPETYQHLQKIREATGTPDEVHVLKSEYSKVEVTSIDYGIIEKTKDIIVIPGDFGWSDIGSWGTLMKVLQDTHSATIITKGHHVGVNNSNCMVLANDKLIATVGLENIVIVDTPDALLVCNSEKSQEVKDLLIKLKDEGKHFYL